jgi:hypothetical protein
MISFINVKSAIPTILHLHSIPSEETIIRVPADICQAPYEVSKNFGKRTFSVVGSYLIDIGPAFAMAIFWVCFT